MVLAAPEERDAAGADEAAMQDVVVVGVDLRLTGPFLEAGLRAGLLHRAGSEHGRRDAVEHRRLMQLHERIGVLPVPSGDVATVDERDVHVGMIDQRVGERHAHRPGADDEVVGLHRPRHQQSEPPDSAGSLGTMLVHPRRRCRVALVRGPDHAEGLTRRQLSVSCTRRRRRRRTGEGREGTKPSPPGTLRTRAWRAAHASERS